MGEYIGIRRFCSLCEYGEINKKDIICKNKESSLYNVNTKSILCSPCFKEKKREKSIEVEYVGFGD